MTRYAERALARIISQIRDRADGIQSGEEYVVFWHAQTYISAGSGPPRPVGAMTIMAVRMRAETVEGDSASRIRHFLLGCDGLRISLSADGLSCLDIS